MEKVRNKRLTDDQFFKIRNQEVLPMWETGKAIENLDECIAVAKELSQGKNFALKLKDAKENGTHVLIPQFGRALTEYMLEGLSYVEERTSMPVNGSWLIYSDSYTRKLAFQKAAEGIERSRQEGMSMLNGWPIVCFGVEEARKIMKTTKVSLSFNSTDEDGRLAAEIALAAGWSSCFSRSLQEVIAHCKHIPLADEIRLNQYEQRLAGIYTENGVPICPWNPANLTGYDSPAYRSFCMVSESLLAAEQGVKHQFIEAGQGMHMFQDIAMMKVTEKLCYEYCKRFGYVDVEFYSGLFPFLGAWPPREEEANAMIAWNAIIGVIGGFPGIILKCQDEAFATPTKEGMAKAVLLADQLLTLMGTQKITESEQLKIEEQMIEMEVRMLMEKCLEAGDGDIAIGICKGVDAGWIDTMLTPWKYNKGNVLLARDVENAVRYVDFGDVPMPKEVKEFHRQKLAEREKKLGKKIGLDIVAQDLQFASVLKYK